MKKTKTRIKGFLSIFLTASLLLSSPACKSPQSKEGTSSPPADQEAPDSREDIIQEISDYPLPSSFEVTKLLVEAGASYILNLCNPVDNVNRYISLKSKALNLGVYGADLSYAATYNQAQETM